MTLKAAGYVRRSVEERRKGNSVEDQKEAIQRTCISSGWTLTDWYVDTGRHGWDILGDQLKRLIDDTIAKRFDVIVVWRQDRLARTPEDIKLLLRFFTFHGVSVYVDGVVLTWENLQQNLLLIGIKAEVSTEELRKTKAAVKDGLHTAIMAGKIVGRPPLGFTVKDNKLVLNDLGQKASQLLNESVRTVAGSLGISIDKAHRLLQNLRAERDGNLFELVSTRSDKQRSRDELLKQQRRMARRELRNYIETKVSPEFEL